MSDRPSALRFVHPLPYGAIVHDGGVQFVVFSRRATAMRVLLYDTAGRPGTGRNRRLRPRSEPLGRHLERFCARRRPGAALPFPGRRTFRARQRPAVRRPRPADRSLCQGPGGRFLPADGRHRPAAEVRGRRRRVRLAGRSPPAPQPARDRDLRDARPRLHVRPSRAAWAIRALSGADREDSLPAIAGRHGGRVDAGLRVSDERVPGAAVEADELLGLRSRWRFSPRTAAMPSATSPAARSASSRKWCWRCTGRASK